MSVARSHQKKAKKPPLWLVAIIYGVFGLAAIYISIALSSHIYNAARTASWEKVDAALLNWEANSSNCSTNRNMALQTKCYVLTATYQYTYDGRSYSGEAVSALRVNDNFSDHWRDRIIDRFRLAESGGAFFVWVNPRNPQEAVVENALPVAATTFYAFFLLFPCGFVIVSLIAILLGFFGGTADEKRLRTERWAYPVSGLLLGTPAVLILLYAPRGDVGFGSGFILAFLLLIMVASLAKMVRNLKH